MSSRIDYAKGEKLELIVTNDAVILSHWSAPDKSGASSELQKHVITNQDHVEMLQAVFRFSWEPSLEPVQ